MIEDEITSDIVARYFDSLDISQIIITELSISNSELREVIFLDYTIISDMCHIAFEVTYVDIMTITDVLYLKKPIGDVLLITKLIEFIR